MEQFFDRGMHKIQAIYSCWGYFTKIDTYYYFIVAIILHFMHNSRLQPTKNLHFYLIACAGCAFVVKGSVIETDPLLSLFLSYSPYSCSLPLIAKLTVSLFIAQHRNHTMDDKQIAALVKINL